MYSLLLPGFAPASCDTSSCHPHGGHACIRLIRQSHAPLSYQLHLSISPNQTHPQIHNVRCFSHIASLRNTAITMHCSLLIFMFFRQHSPTFCRLNQPLEGKQPFLSSSDVLVTCVVVIILSRDNILTGREEAGPVLRPGDPAQCQGKGAAAPGLGVRQAQGGLIPSEQRGESQPAWSVLSVVALLAGHICPHNHTCSHCLPHQQANSCPRLSAA